MHPHHFLSAIAFIFLALASAHAAEKPEPASVPVADEVPREAFLILQKLQMNAALRDGKDPTLSRLPEEHRAPAISRMLGNERELLKAAGNSQWPEASKRVFIQAVDRDGEFAVEVRPLIQPGFKPQPILLKGWLSPASRERLRALLPPPPAG